MEPSPVPKPPTGRPRSLFREFKLKAWRLEQSEISGRPSARGPSVTSPDSESRSGPARKDRHLEKTGQHPDGSDEVLERHIPRYEPSKSLQPAPSQRDVSDNIDQFNVEQRLHPASELENNRSVDQSIPAANEYMTPSKRYISCFKAPYFGAPMEVLGHSNRCKLQRPYPTGHPRSQPGHHHLQNLSNSNFSDSAPTVQHDQVKNDALNYNNSSMHYTQGTQHLPVHRDVRYFPSTCSADSLPSHSSITNMDTDSCSVESVRDHHFNVIPIREGIPPVYEAESRVEGIYNETSSMKQMLRERIMGTQSTFSAPSSASSSTHSFESFTQHLLSSQKICSVADQPLTYAMQHSNGKRSSHVKSSGELGEFEKFLNKMRGEFQGPSEASIRGRGGSCEQKQKEFDAGGTVSNDRTDTYSSGYSGGEQGGYYSVGPKESVTDLSSDSLNNTYLVPMVFKQDKSNGLVRGFPLVDASSGMILSPLPQTPPPLPPRRQDRKRGTFEKSQEHCLKYVRLSTAGPASVRRRRSNNEEQASANYPPSQNGEQISQQQYSHRFGPYINTSTKESLCKTPWNKAVVSDGYSKVTNVGDTNVYSPSFFPNQKSRRPTSGAESVMEKPMTTWNDIQGLRLYSPPNVTPSGQVELDRSAITEGLLNCEVCEDRATGLHYGIVTCEGYVGL